MQWHAADGVCLGGDVNKQNGHDCLRDSAWTTFLSDFVPEKQGGCTGTMTKPWPTDEELVAMAKARLLWQ